LPTRSDGHDITVLLTRWRQGDEGAFDHLVPIVYHELRQAARRHVRREPLANTLEPTDLAHEAFMRLAREGRRVDWHDRVHFFALASTIMRRILVEHARRRRAAKRGAHQTSLSISGSEGAQRPMSLDVLALHEALDRLERMDPRQARVVELRYFAGLNVDEIGEAMKLSVATVKREWQVARLWLHRELSAGSPE
jgi:RNA polymerase sigma factor (TIGR02999 family)